MANTGVITILQPDTSPFGEIAEGFFEVLGKLEVFADQTSTGFTGYDLENGVALDVAGTGLTYDSKGVITGGIATSFTVRDEDGRLFAATFAPGTKAVDVAKASVAFADSGFTDASKLEAIFGAYELTFRGHDGGEEFGGAPKNDTLFGGAGEDTLSGGPGNDIIEGGAGDDTLDGEEGIDTVSYANSTTGVTVDLSIVAPTAQSSPGDASGDKLKNFENILGSAFDDELIGDGNANVITGGKGGDALNGAGGIDTLFGGDGNDFVNSGAGADVLDGGAGVDALEYNTVKTSITVLLGAKDVQTTVTGTAGSDAVGDKIKNFERVFGGDGNDVLTGNADANRINGNDGDDVIQGGAGADDMDGGDNTAVGDTLSYAGSKDGVTIDLDTGEGFGGDAEGDNNVQGFENVIGSGKNDKLTTGAGLQRVEGGAGDDVIVELNAVRVIGGVGIDTLSFDGVNFAASIDLSLQGTADAKGNITGGGGGTGNVGFGQAAQIENLTGSSKDDDLAGDKNANVIEGGVGADKMKGNGGIDTASYAGSANGVTVDLDAAGGKQDFGSTGDSEDDTLAGFTNILGSSKGDKLRGSNAQANSINGAGGDDTVVGDVGADTLDGGIGNDTLDYQAVLATQNVTVTLGAKDVQTMVTTSGVAGSVAAGDKIKNFENVLGGAGNDVVFANASANALDGNGGTDTANYSKSANGVTIDLAGTAGTGGDAAGDKLTDFEVLIGSAKNDALSGGLLVDTIDGGVGDDIIDGRLGADVLIGGMGVNTLSYASTGGGVSVTLVFNMKAQTSLGAAAGDNATGFQNLIGGAGGDQLTGDTKNNVIEGGADADIMNGGAGNDTLSYTGSGAGVTVGLDAAGNISSPSGGDAGGDSGGGFENLLGSAFEDQLTGNDLANVISGGGDDDTLIGGKGIDTINGGDGDDVIDGGAGADVMDGGAGGDDQLDYIDLAAGVTVTLAFGEAGKQTMVTATAGSDAAGDKIMNFEHYLGGDAKDVVTGNSLANILEGSAGNDVFSGGAGNDLIFGDGGDDLVEGGAGADVLEGGSNGAPGDTLSYATSDAGVTVNLSDKTASGGHAQGDDISVGGFENLIGSAKNDALTAGLGGKIDGLAGDDVIEGRVGADILIGGAHGASGDTVSYFNAVTGVTIDLNNQDGVKTQTGGDAAGDKLQGFENVLGGGGNDKLTGDKGNNVIEGGTGDDTLDGGLGIDTLSFANAAFGVVIDLSKAGPQNTGAVGTDTVSGFENILGSAQNDNELIGNDGANKIEGGKGEDGISGGKGKDTLLGGDDNDFITGGADADVIDGGAGIDTVSYQGEAGAIVTLGKNGTTAATVGGSATGDKITNVENIAGSFLNDNLTGNNLDNEIMGDFGDDVIQGGAGADKLDGGDNGAAGDTLSYSLSALGVTVSLNPSASGGDAEGDTISNFENLIGTAKNDDLRGEAGGNKIDGGLGDDIIEGRAGADTLIGGMGNDTLSYAGDNTGVTVTLIAGKAATVSGGHAASDNATGFEHLVGGSDADELTGDTGNNIIEGGDGGDTLSGGLGVNTLSYASSDAAVTVNLGTAAGIFTALHAKGGDAEGDTIDTSFTNLVGSAHNDLLRGNSGSNTISGNAGNDSLFGGGGGNDTFNGGDGFDFVTFGGPGGTNSVTINLAAGTATTSTAKHTLLSMEAVQGGDVADSFSAIGFNSTSKNAGSTGINNHVGAVNQFEGLKGDDVILGNGFTRITYHSNQTSGVTVDLKDGSAKSADSGNDTIVGGVNQVRGSKFDDDLFGSDVLDVEVFEGLGGNDDIDGRGGFDRASYASEASGVTVTLVAGNLATVTGTSAGSDTIKNVEFFRGSDDIDTFVATLYTNGFDDLNEFEGLGGDDDITGNGETRVSYQSSSASVSVNLAAEIATGADIGNDKLTDNTIKSVRGSDFDDIIRGNGNDNVLNGGLGNDSLEGTGGADTFVYSLDDKNGGGIDTIQDYFAGVDSIDLGGISSMLVYADVRALMTDVGADVVINFGGGNQIIVLNTTTADFDANKGDFLFA